MTDVALLTEKRYLNAPSKADWYIENILLEDLFIQKQLKKLNISSKRVAWDETPDLGCFRYVLFRTTWNYFEKLKLFLDFLYYWKDRVTFINSYEQIMWNLNKGYLIELESVGINIPETIICKKGGAHNLSNICSNRGWSEIIIKPCVSAAAWQTHRLKGNGIFKSSTLFNALVSDQDMMIQVFQKKILSAGELSLMIINGEYSHAVLKKAKNGDFRVQDDYGGSVCNYSASQNEIAFAKKVMESLPFSPIYARVDILIDNNGCLALSELELIEPEMWFRMAPLAAQKLARSVKKVFFN